MRNISDVRGGKPVRSIVVHLTVSAVNPLDFTISMEERERCYSFCPGHHKRLYLFVNI
jgi:hypothetical protein